VKVVKAVKVWWRRWRWWRWRIQPYGKSQRWLHDDSGVDERTPNGCRRTAMATMSKPSLISDPVKNYTVLLKVNQQRERTVASNQRWMNFTVCQNQHQISQRLLHLKTSEQSIDKAIAAIPASERQSPEFVLNVINQMLKNRRNIQLRSLPTNLSSWLTRLRGFAAYAEDLYQTTAQQMSQERPENHQRLWQV